MIHAPGVAGYLVSAPDPKRSGRRSFSTFPVDFEPPWLKERHRRDIRITPLTADEYAKPLLDIIQEHAHKLRDPQPAAPVKEPEPAIATHDRLPPK